MREDRGPWYLLTGLIVGLVIGVLYAWSVDPVEYVDTTPATLRQDYKERYRALIAAAYIANGDVVRARARLELLKDPDLYRALAEQAQKTLAEGSSPEEARALGLLAVAIGQADGLPGPAPAVTQPVALPTSPQPSLAVPPATDTSAPTTPAPSPTVTPTLATPTATSGASAETPEPSATFLPTRTATPTPGLPFALQSQDQACEQSLAEPRLEVLVLDAAGQGVPGMEVVVTWDAGEEHFFTGLKPELGIGYADFTLQPGSIYAVRLAEGGQPVTGLQPVDCESSGGERHWGAWRLTFTQP